MSIPSKADRKRRSTLKQLFIKIPINKRATMKGGDANW
jgi:hypothetical protein